MKRRNIIKLLGLFMGQIVAGESSISAALQAFFQPYKGADLNNAEAATAYSIELGKKFEEVSKEIVKIVLSGELETLYGQAVDKRPTERILTLSAISHFLEIAGGAAEGGDCNYSQADPSIKEPITKVFLKTFQTKTVFKAFVIFNRYYKIFFREHPNLELYGDDIERAITNNTSLTESKDDAIKSWMKSYQGWIEEYKQNNPCFFNYNSDPLKDMEAPTDVVGNEYKIPKGYEKYKSKIEEYLENEKGISKKDTEIGLILLRIGQYGIYWQAKCDLSPTEIAELKEFAGIATADPAASKADSSAGTAPKAENQGDNNTTADPTGSGASNTAADPAPDPAGAAAPKANNPTPTNQPDVQRRNDDPAQKGNDDKKGETNTPNHDVKNPAKQNPTWHIIIFGLFSALLISACIICFVMFGRKTENAKLSDLRHK